MSTLDAVTEQSFDAEVLQSPNPVLVDFWAEWCGPCKRITPILEKVSATYSGRVKILKLNVDENSAIATKYGVRGIPTLMLYKNGKIAATKVGTVTETQLSDFLDSHL
jgi:thioredoxin 1